MKLYTLEDWLQVSLWYAWEHPERARYALASWGKGYVRDCLLTYGHTPTYSPNRRVVEYWDPSELDKMPAVEPTRPRTLLQDFVLRGNVPGQCASVPYDKRFGTTEPILQAVPEQPLQRYLLLRYRAGRLTGWTNEYRFRPLYWLPDELLRHPAHYQYASAIPDNKSCAQG